MINQVASTSICTNCGWKEPSEVATCPQCGQTMDGSSPPPATLEPAHTFSLRTLLLAMAIVSVLLAVSTHNHWLGLVLSLIGFPALLRAAAMGRFARNQQAKWGWNERLVSVLESLLIMWLIMIVGAVVVITLGFLISIPLTVAQVPPHVTVPIALLVAAIGAVALIVHLIRRSWPKAQK